jgi:hypothetical protein
VIQSLRLGGDLDSKATFLVEQGPYSSAVAPARARAKHVNNAADHPPIINSASPAAAHRQQPLNPLPLLVATRRSTTSRWSREGIWLAMFKAPTERRLSAWNLAMDYAGHSAHSGGLLQALIVVGWAET